MVHLALKPYYVGKDYEDNVFFPKLSSLLFDRTNPKLYIYIYIYIYIYLMNNTICILHFQIRSVVLYFLRSFREHSQVNKLIELN